MNTIDIAKIAHEANRAYCETLGDRSQPPWDEAPDWQKNSAINGVISIQINPDMAPEQCHEKWMAQKQAEGWTHGPVKDPEKKEHPCLVPYGELPEKQKVKDLLFSTIVKALVSLPPMV